jgi:hypothetical protein
MNNVEINVARDFSDKLGGRYIEYGKFSGEDFRNRILLPKFEEAIRKKCKLIIHFDGVLGYPVSFLEEAFGGLARIRDQKTVKKNIEIIATEAKGLNPDIMRYIEEARIRRRK